MLTLERHEDYYGYQGYNPLYTETCDEKDKSEWAVPVRDKKGRQIMVKRCVFRYSPSQSGLSLKDLIGLARKEFPKVPFKKLEIDITTNAAREVISMKHQISSNRKIDRVEKVKLPIRKY